ncbi:4'-phosphopantetheinyl transferase Sfp [subsurface metagenome]
MQSPANHLPLPREVHIWRVSLQQQQDVVARHRMLLSLEEKQRSARFHFERDRGRYTIARGSLRTILSGYIGRSPGELRFDTGRYGKPFLVNLGEAEELEFNLSHCEDLALIAVTSGQSVGVDVEKIREMQDLSLILNRFFTVEERGLVDSFPDGERTAAFLSLWVRREAAAKARGLNLSAALSKTNLQLYPLGEGICIEEPDQRTWFIQDLKLDPYHVGAVCVEGKKCSFVIREFK